ncbi:MAG: MerR family transcriptional regulator [Sandaracinaceae bacterium]|nr:MerR family transcriptional regulator [Sandaracinaceae bacterium]MDW8246816.1 MerR family transcriptional regulator [Sandaracinaceae bacterium]
MSRESDESARNRLSPATYPIRVVTRMTGLSPDLIRVWERRYNAITPQRTLGKARRYSLDDIRRLNLLRQAVALGHSISSIASLSNEEIELIVKRCQSTAFEFPTRSTIDSYLKAIEGFDIQAAEAILNQALEQLGMRRFIHELARPLLHEVGDRWHNGQMSIGEEHAVTAQLRSIFFTFLRNSIAAPGAPRLVFATPPAHRHEMGALIASVLATIRGIRAIYLGPDTPFEEIANAVERSSAKAAVLSIPMVLSSEEALREELEGISWLAQRSEVWVGASPGHPALTLPNITPFSDFGRFELALEVLAATLPPP